MEICRLKPSLERLIQSLSEGLIEREIPSRLILLSALAGEHTLLVGPPGTAKSVLARKLHNVFSDGDYFERLLTRFSVPEELFGPLSIKALEGDQYHRLTEHYLPSASIAFIDEIFKANSAILNSLLTILNEGEFDNGTTRVKVPLISVVAASNELPDETDLEALYDRFLVRYQVQPVSNQQFETLLTLSTDSSAMMLSDTDKLTPATIEDIQQKAEQVSLSDEVIQLLGAMRDYLNQQNRYVSDRRWRKVVKLLKVSAYTNGQTQVSIWDCWLLQHCLWNAPEQREELANCYESHLGIGTGFYPQRLEKLIATWEHSLSTDRASEVQQVNASGHKLYLNTDQQQTTAKRSVEWLRRDDQALYLSPPGPDDRSNANVGYTRHELLDYFFDSHYQQTHIDGRWQHIDEYIRQSENHLMLEQLNPPCMEPAKHSSSFIENRVQEASVILTDLTAQQNNLGEFLKSAKQEIVDHLWIDSSFKDTAVNNLAQSQQQMGKLIQRIDAVIEGYRGLPRL